MNKTLPVILILLTVMLIFSCKKKADIAEPGNEIGTDTDTDQEEKDITYQPEEGSAAPSLGFFLEDWKEKSFVAPDKSNSIPAYDKNAHVTITADMNKIITRVSSYLFGNNVNPYMTQIIDQPVLMQYLKDLSPRIIRGPGGSISDIYFWNSSGQIPFPSDLPDKLLDADGNRIEGGYWKGGLTDSWTLSLDHYYQMLEETGSTGMLTVNYGYARYGTGPEPVRAAAHYAADWIRYDNGRTKYWEIGNESFGSWEAGYRIDTDKNQDGRPGIQTGELYGDHFNVFADSMKAAAQETGADIRIGAVLYETVPASWETSTIKNWNSGVLRKGGKKADFFSVHHYFGDFQTDATADDILATYTETEAIISYLEQQLTQYGIEKKPVALTEWNINATGSNQSVSNIAGLHAALVLGELIKNGFGAAARWNLANGWNGGDDHGMFNIGDEPDAPRWNPRPSFYYLYYFQKTIGDRLVQSRTDDPDVSAYVSSYGNAGEHAGVALINRSGSPKDVVVKLDHFPEAGHYYLYVLRGGEDSGPFSGKVLINEIGPDGASGGPLNYKEIAACRLSTENGIRVNMRPYSAAFMVTDK